MPLNLAPLVLFCCQRLAAICLPVVGMGTGGSLPLCGSWHAIQLLQTLA